MPRVARVVAVGLPHHITQRGNYKQTVFYDDEDRKRYLSWVEEYSVEHGVFLLVYSLMVEHVHFIAIPEREDSFAKAFSAAHMRYSQYINKKRQVRGHLWQGRFYSCTLDENHLIAAAKYIERNPVRAKMVKKPWQWKWSSAQYHINKVQSLIKLTDLFKFIDTPYNSWKEYIDSEEDEVISNNIRKNTLTGRPLGSDIFIKRLEEKFDKRLIALPRGRPYKK